MEYPTAIRDDIQQNAEIDLLVRVESSHEASGVRERILLTDIEGDQLQLTLFDQSPEYDFVEGEWFVLRGASGNVYEGQKELRPNFGDMNIEHVPDPPDDLIPDSTTGQSAPPSADVDADEARIALDIETVMTVDEEILDLDDSTHLELLCIGEIGRAHV